MNETVLNETTVKRISVGEKKVAEVIDYLQRHTVDGRLTRSLLDIAEQMNCSNATVHRAIKRLEAKGLIKVIPGKKPTDPNTIVYTGPNRTPAQDILSEGSRLIDEMAEVTKKLALYFETLSATVNQLAIDSELYYDQQKRVVDTIDLPDQDHLMLILQKEANTEH